MPKKRERRRERRDPQRKPDHRLAHTIEEATQHWGGERSNRHREGKRDRYRGHAHHVVVLKVKGDQSKIHITGREERSADRIPPERGPIAHDRCFAFIGTWNDGSSCRRGSAKDRQGRQRRHDEDAESRGVAAARHGKRDDEGAGGRADLIEGLVDSESATASHMATRLRERRRYDRFSNAAPDAFANQKTR